MGEHTTFGDLIRQERVRADLGLREAARRLGISASYLSRLEAGEFRPPSGALLLRISHLYGSDIKKLMDLASDRAAEVMAADTTVAPAVQAFYRLAHDQPPEIQELMLSRALEVLDMPEHQKKQILNQVRAMLSRSRGWDLPRSAAGDDGLLAIDIAPRFLCRETIRSLANVVLHSVCGVDIPVPIPLETVIHRWDRNITLVVHDEIEGGRLRDGSPAVLGLSRWSRDGRRRELVVHEELFEAKDTATRRRANFTIAHELFHCVEHLPLVQARHPDAALARSPAFVSLAPELAGTQWFRRARQPKKLSTREDWREWQANTFAAELLMPADVVKEAFKELFGLPQLVAEGVGLGEFADAAARASTGLGETKSLVDRFDVNPQAMAIRLMALDLVKACEKGEPG